MWIFIFLVRQRSGTCVVLLSEASNEIPIYRIMSINKGASSLFIIYIYFILYMHCLKNDQLGLSNCLVYYT